MKINFQELFSSPYTYNTKTKKSKNLIEIKFPEPYNIHAKVSEDNYLAEIQNVCKMHHIPNSIKDFVIMNLENKQEKIQYEENSTLVDQKAFLNNSLEQTNSSLNLYQKEINRKNKEKIDVSKYVFEREKKRRVEQNTNLGIIKPNPSVFIQLNTKQLDKKPFCATLINTQIKKQFESRMQIQQKPKILNTKIGIRPPSNIHNKLYNLHHKLKLKQGTKNFLHEYKNKSTYRPSIIKQTEYLKNYKPFFERLSTEIQNRKKREQFLELNTSIDFATNKQLFKPEINHRPNIKSRVYLYQSKSIQQIDYSQEKPSSHSHFRLNKSIQIIKNKQNNYLSTVVDKLFQNDKLKFDSVAISKLDDQEFKILYPFLNVIEKNRQISKKQFQIKLNKYYNDLGMPQKHFLTFLNRQSSKQQLTEFSQNSNHFKPRINKNSSAMGDKYLQKIKEFI